MRIIQSAAYQMNQQHPDWEDVAWVDLFPEPGSFLSTEPPKHIQMFGETVTAFNWLHAQYLFFKHKAADNGEDFGKCSHCGKRIRYAIAFKDPQNHFHLVGQDCAMFIGSGMTRKDYAETKMLSEIKAVQTAGGERFTMKVKMPEWFWSIPKEQRPKYTSASPWEHKDPKGRGMVRDWYLTIWGANKSEVINNWEDLKKLGIPIHRQKKQDDEQEAVLQEAERARKVQEDKDRFKALSVVGLRVKVVNRQQAKRHGQGLPALGSKGTINSLSSYGMNYQTIPTIGIRWDIDPGRTRYIGVLTPEDVHCIEADSSDQTSSSPPSPHTP